MLRSDYWLPDWKEVAVNVYWRSITVATGVGIAGLASLMLCPVYASDLARRKFEEVMRECSLALADVVEARPLESFYFFPNQ